MAALTAPQLLKMEEKEFDSTIQDLSVKNLIETITALQKEMSKEQENFNSLSSELATLKRNSGQYKSVSKDMSASQTRLTLLMNRSMKCFSQQGNQNKATVERRNSFQGSHSNVQNRTSEPVKSNVVTQSTVVVNSKDQSKRHSAMEPGSKPSIQVQSLKSNSPLLGCKTTISVNGSGSIHEDSRKYIGSNKSDKVKSDVNVNEDLEKSKVNGQQNSVADSSTRLGPMEEQRKRFISKSSDNVFKKPVDTAPHKTEVVKGKATKPISKVVMNADKQMIDLDSFTDRKNLLEELKKFEKPLKPSVGKTHTEKVTEVKLNLAKSGEKRSSAKLEPSPVTPVEQNVNLLGDIKLGKKPSELKQNKTINVKTERGGNNSVQAVTLESTKEVTFSQRGPQNNSQSKMFDDLLKDVDSDKSEQSSEESPREKINASWQVKATVPMPDENNTASYSGRKDVDIPATGEVTIEEAKESTSATETSDDSMSQSSGMSEEDDKFVTEFHFTGSQFKSPPTNDAIPKKQGKLCL